MKKLNKLITVLPLNSTLLAYSSNTKEKTGIYSCTRQHSQAQVQGNISMAIQNFNSSAKQINSVNPSPLQKAIGTGARQVESTKQKVNTAFFGNSLLNGKNLIKGWRFARGQGNSAALNSNALFYHNTKSVVYSFNKVNNLYPLFTKTEYLLKSVFRSMYSLISRPIYLIKHDKVIIRLFVYLSPKIDKYLDTSTIGASLDNGLSNNSNTRLGDKNKRSVAGFSARTNRFKIGKFLKFKSLRPNVLEILKSQIQSSAWPWPHGEAARANKLFSANSLLPSNSIINNIAPNNRLNSLLSSSGCLSLGSPMARGEQVKEVTINSKNFEFPYKSLVSNFKFKLEKLCLVFEKIFNKKVEFEIIKAQLPFQDSNVLAQILGYNANNYKFRRMLKILIPRAVIKNPSKVYLRSQNKVISPNSIFSSVPSPMTRTGVTDTVSPLLMSADAQSERDKLSYGLPTLTKGLSPAPQKERWGEADAIRGFKNLKTLISQPSSYLPPFFYNKYNFNIETAKYPSLDLKNSSLSYLSGMNIKLAGRLMTQSIRPRFTVQSLQEGSLARVKVHYIEKSRFTGKNKRGAFSFTVTISHVFN
jgi:hypothetical protein